MLPLAAVDPELPNKEAAARMLREWVHSRRAAVQQSIMSATAADGGAAGVRGGGSTLQDQPEMLLPYGLYILAHHPDFPQVRGSAGCVVLVVVVLVGVSACTWNTLCWILAMHAYGLQSSR
jgi:hypothetical protein